MYELELLMNTIYNYFKTQYLHKDRLIKMVQSQYLLYM